ncbi:MAG: glutathione S-transferase N-terminal domain-containing protein [Phenylobacterium sp.]|uniref:glutathione S-transferase family protein n=1 Tax=Brevundimonas sp. TaxID=1871086 RepID=UPI002737B712|nr:glutathione S-transferase N-terminal domain-containing protein [Brevundimonas sp.]MDP3802185.1 glutathione S-transferase N-terminal domain-containing protein [Brevundimonas sp.]MDZ4370697.1 glutathione S-transferase N-terminal domain-containing protein [Phenylobacterium sp.]
MKLYITAPSPYARKCRIVAREKGLASRIEEIAVDPYANAPELLASNPVVQVPTLIAGDGLPINDSPVICEYLDGLGSGPRLLPADGPERLRVRRLETLGNQALEMGVKLVLELRRPEHERSPSWIDRWTGNMARALDALEAAAPDPGGIDMGVITAGVAATWIGFRHPGFDLSTRRPRLMALQAALEERPSFAETRPG